MSLDVLVVFWLVAVSSDQTKTKTEPGRKKDRKGENRDKVKAGLHHCHCHSEIAAHCPEFKANGYWNC